MTTTITVTMVVEHPEELNPMDYLVWYFSDDHAYDVDPFEVIEEEIEVYS